MGERGYSDARAAGFERAHNPPSMPLAAAFLDEECEVKAGAVGQLSPLSMPLRLA